MARQPLPTRLERSRDPVKELRTVASLAAITLLGAGALLLLLPDTLVVSPQVDAAVLVTSAILLLAAAAAGTRTPGAGGSTAAVAVGLVLSSTWAFAGILGAGLTTAVILTAAGAVQAALALRVLRRAAPSAA